MAFIVVRFVCPAVTAADHARMTTNGAIDVTVIRIPVRFSLGSASPNERRHTGDPIAEQQRDAVVRERVHEDGAEDGDAVGEGGGECTAVLPVRRRRHRAEDHNDCTPRHQRVVNILPCL